jgi:four helix bundle suffix protein
MTLWTEEDPLRTELIRRRCKDADAVAEWVREVYQRERSEENRKIKLNIQSQKNDPMGKSIKSMKSIPSRQSSYPELTANAAITLIVVTCSLLDRQIASQAEAFETEGGFTERLYQRRKDRRSWD